MITNYTHLHLLYCFPYAACNYTGMLPTLFQWVKYHAAFSMAVYMVTIVIDSLFVMATLIKFHFSLVIVIDLKYQTDCN